jgi:hypothetical protein
MVAQCHPMRVVASGADHRLRRGSRRGERGGERIGAVRHGQLRQTEELARGYLGAARESAKVLVQPLGVQEQLQHD